MPLLASTSIAAAAHALPVTLALSGIFGSISLTSWICLLLPQLFANYKAKSADGLSMAFLIVWLLGDVTNLIGEFPLRSAFLHTHPKTKFVSRQIPLLRHFRRPCQKICYRLEVACAHANLDTC
jgi:uncharacterized protein with PQ loop repeat